MKLKLQKALRDYLRQHFPGNVHTEPWCTCGGPNHVRVFLFRVNGQPASVLVHEACELPATQLRRALPGAQIEPLTEEEFEAAYAGFEPGRVPPFESPFGAAVFIDRNVARFTTMVFCPQMFSGRAGECFRVPTGDFRKLVHASVLPLFPVFVPAR
jgi:prolyl-tRNA editing enzyme YbaK/EbsC (Cys-tRNA(Pro) deacylase)